MKALFYRVTIIFLSCVIGIAGIEFCLRTYFSIFTNYDIEMWRYAALLKQKVADERSHIHKSNTVATIMGQEVRINTKGLRDRDYPYTKNNSTYRILSIGDSFTFGFGVPQDNNFSKLLEKHLNKTNLITKNMPYRYEVINAGVGNYNTLQELAFLKLEGHNYKPDHILLNFYLNDGEKTQKYNNNILSQFSASYIFLSSIRYKIASIMDIKNSYHTHYSSLYKGDNWVAYQILLENFILTTKQMDAKLTVVILPDYHDTIHYPFLDIHTKIKEFFEKRDVKVIDTLGQFINQPAKNYWVADDDPHPNALAHDLIAKIIIEEIEL